MDDVKKTEKTPKSGDNSFAKGRCITYWETGTCKRDFKCRFKHVANPANQPKKADDTPTQPNWHSINGSGKIQAVDKAFPTYSVGDDIANHLCTAPCRQPRDCCGRTCTAPCHACQFLSPLPDEALPKPSFLHTDPWDEMMATDAPSLVKIPRVKHQPHRCDKTLDICGHQCSGTCQPGHQHPPCAARCLQQCAHKKCTKTCKTPCAPCQESCKWSCEHRKCSMPCAMPCDRLPCDVHCQNILDCGHPCPSVCGEPCHDQLCPQCANEDQQAQIIDFTMQATLAETIADDPSTRMITLACGHIFTVETLDRHVDFSQCYEVDDQGVTRGLRIPDSGAFTARPTCPTCRGPISSPRYNRVTKRAMLDIQEQHAIHDFARDIDKARKVLSSFNFEEAKDSVATCIANILSPKHYKLPQPRQIESLLTLTSTDVRCIQADLFFTQRMDDVFCIGRPLGLAWRNLVDKPMRVYKNMVRIVNGAALPHVKAYENAITSVYRNELDLARSRQSDEPNSSTPQRDLSERAMVMARRTVGAPFPNGESRFKIQALIETIKIRLQLAPIAREFYLSLRRDTAALAPTAWSERAAAGRSNLSARRFNIFGVTLLRSCQRDAQLAANMCESSGAKRLALSVELLALESHFAVKRWQSQAKLEDARFGREDSVRTKEIECLLTERSNAMDRFDHALLKIVGDNMEMENGGISGGLRDVIETSIRPVKDSIMEEWNDFAMFLATGAFYQPVSLEERMAVARAVMQADYGTSGRFYQCPSGHTYTVGECGQTMEESRCPECGAMIGGQNHNLRSDNVRDVQMDQLANQAGARLNPHAMG